MVSTLKTNDTTTVRVKTDIYPHRFARRKKKPCLYPYKPDVDKKADAIYIQEIKGLSHLSHTPLGVEMGSEYGHASLKVYATK